MSTPGSIQPQALSASTTRRLRGIPRGWNGACKRFTTRPEVADSSRGVGTQTESAAGGGQGGLNSGLQQGNWGVLSVVQFTYLANHAPGDSGMPGQFTLGGFYDSNSFSSLSQPNATESGTYSLYSMFQQMVYRAGGGEQPARADRLGQGGLCAAIACQPHALFCGRWRELSGPLAWPRQRHCLSRGSLAGRSATPSPRPRPRPCWRRITSSPSRAGSPSRLICQVHHPAERQQRHQQRVGLGRTAGHESLAPTTTLTGLDGMGCVGSTGPPRRARSRGDIFFFFFFFFFL